MRVSAQAPRFFVIYDSQFPLDSSRFGRESIQYRVGKTHCQGHQDPSKRVSIFLGTQEANVKMVSINRVSIPRSRTVYLCMYAESVDRGRVEAASISSFRHIRERESLSDFAKDFSRVCSRTLGK